MNLCFQFLVWTYDLVTSTILVDQGPHHLWRMQCLHLEEELNSFPPSLGNLSCEGKILSHPQSETMSAHLDHHIEGKFEVIEDGFLSSNNPPLTKPIGPPIVKLPYARYIDHFAHYRLPP